MNLLTVPAVILYASILAGLGIGSYLMYRAGNEREDWIILGTGVLLGLIAAVLGFTGTLGLKAEKMMGYLPAIPIPFAVTFLYLTRKHYGGKISRYVEIISIGLAINSLLYIPHLFWHFSRHKIGHLPSWGLNPSFWYVFYHGLSAVGFIYIAYGFYLFWTSIAE
ncbi:MAG: hypothetical protein ABEK04_06100 [Candidatus Nanohalobium sp.]